MSATGTTDNVALSHFERNVKQALRLYDQPERLGQESPLASPYMLARAMRTLPRPVTARDRGELLRSLIYAAAARLWGETPPATRDELLGAIAVVRRDPGHPRYSYIVLELRCFQRLIKPGRMSDIWEHEDLLLGSKSQHYRDFDAAVKCLAPLLLDCLHPSLRPERPRPPAALYGYDQQLAQLVAALAAGKTVALGGPGGVGKTSLGATALAYLGERPCFWYTLRPGFNDGLGNLLFALGAFLHDLGPANLWQYLVTANGVFGDLNLVAGLLRQDLAALNGAPPLLCFDDLEHLALGTLGQPTPAGARLLDLIEALRGAVPLLLISQRPLPACDLHLELPGLPAEGIERLWEDAGYRLAEAEVSRLLAYTGGNPRLLNLLLTLYHEGEPVEQFGDETARTLLPAFQRLWRRLSPDERLALQRLSVYLSYAPEEVVVPTTCAALAQLRLIEGDGEGGVAVIPALRNAIADELAPELRANLHREAAIVHLERAEYTGAAYHFVQAGDEQQAVRLWFPQRQYALARGEAEIARAIFTRIGRERLDPAERKALDLIRAELRRYAAEHEEGLRELEQADWGRDSEATARLWMLRGELEDALGYPDRAVRSYGEGVQVASRLLGQLAALHHRSGLLYNRRRELKQSWEAVYKTEFELEVLRGLLLDEEGDYDQALEAFRRARIQADRLDDDALRAQTERWLAIVYGRREQLAQAVEHATRSAAIYERLGDRLNLEKMRTNLSSIYNQCRAYEETLAVGVPAYAFFLSVRDPYYAAGTAANLAEASCQLGNLAEAERYANEVLALDQPFTIPYAHFTLGEIALKRGDLQEAITNFAASTEGAKRNEDPYMAAFAQRSLGEAYRAAGNLPAAEAQMREALAVFRQLDLPNEIEITEVILAG